MPRHAEPEETCYAVSEETAKLVRRPNFRVDGRKLYFLASRRPYRQFSEQQAAVWDALIAEPTLDALESTMPGSASIALEFERGELCDLVETDFPSARRRVLVLEPHADDAVLSVGGSMWRLRRQCEFTIATLASRTNFTSYFYAVRDFFDVEEVMRIRRLESQHVVRMLGGAHVELGMTDAVMRDRPSRWTIEYFTQRRMSIAASTARLPRPGEVKRWQSAIVNLIRTTRPQEIWVPCGSPHADHIIAAASSLAALSELRLRDIPIAIYRDVPYAARNPQHTRLVLEMLERSGISLSRAPIDISRCLDRKLRLISVYASQFKMSAMAKDVEASARTHGGELVEELWRVLELPPNQESDDLIPVEYTDRCDEARAAGWIKRNRTARGLRLVLLVPTGRLQDDVRELREAFPDAEIEICASSTAMAEAEEAVKVVQRASVVLIRRSVMSWANLALRLLFASSPLLFHAGTRRFQLARYLSRLWFRTDCLTVSSMDSTVRALGRVTRADRHESVQAKTDVMVITVNYKTAQFVLRCLGSIEKELASDPAVHIRVTVVDNDSGDADRILAEVRARGWSDWVCVLAAPRNGGFAYGNNVGIRAAMALERRPDMYLLLNPDTEVRPSAIHELVRFLRAKPEAGIAGSSFEDASGKPWEIAFRFPSVLAQLEQGARFGPLTRMLRSKVVARQMGSEPEQVDWVAGASLMIRREVIRDIGFMDENYFLYFEEVDFCLQARRAGWQAWYVPSSRVMHVFGQSTGVSSSDRSLRRMPAYWFESRTRYFVKNFGVLGARLADGAFALGLLLRTLRYRLARRSDTDHQHFLTDFLRTNVIFKRRLAVEKRARLRS